jgi:hypothetical protein
MSSPERQGMMEKSGNGSNGQARFEQVPEKLIGFSVGLHVKTKA